MTSRLTWKVWIVDPDHCGGAFPINITVVADTLHTALAMGEAWIREHYRSVGRIYVNKIESGSTVLL